ncbi:hypothetical protein Tco_0169545 [Tanacetum coccineum]
MKKDLHFLAGEQGNTFDADVDNQPVQDLALNEDNIFQADECDAFDSDVDDEPTAQSIFMANLSSVGSANPQAGLSNASILFEVAIYEQRAKFELTEREQRMDDQMRMLIQNHNKTEENLKKELQFFQDYKQLNRAMKAVFENLEAEVDQNETDLRSGEIEWKNLLITNENLVAELHACPKISSGGTTSHSDHSLPEYESFCFDVDHIKEKSSGSTTSHSDHSFPEYESFCFDVDHIEEKSSGSTTSHSDLSLLEYESFHFDLSIDPLPPADRSDYHLKEFADELAHIISPPEYDHFYFDLEDISSLDPRESTPVIGESTLLVTPLPDSKEISLREVERFDPFFSLTQSGEKKRVMKTPSFSSHHMPSSRPAAYSPKEVMYCYCHPHLTPGDGFDHGPKMK